MSHQKNVSISIALLLSLIVAPNAHAQSAARYEAMLSDGTRVEGSQLTGWHGHHTVPQLENVRLQDERRQLVWFRNRSVSPPNPNSNSFGLVEFFGGDRLVGRVKSFQPESEIDGASTPHLLIELVNPMHLPARYSFRHRNSNRPVLNHVRVLPDRIQRVVWGPTLQRRLRPGTVFYHGGGQLIFRRLRWKPNSVMLLLENGTREVSFSEIAEIHLPKKDPWQAYFDELAMLSPECKSRLLRIETTEGLIATGSQFRFRAIPYGRQDEEIHLAWQEKERARRNLMNLQKRAESLEAQRNAQQSRLKKAQETFSRQSAGFKKQAKAQRDAAQKRRSEMQKQIDKFKKEDAKKFEKQRQQLEQRIRESDKALQQELAKLQTKEDQSKRKLEGAVKGWENYLKQLEATKRAMAQKKPPSRVEQGQPESWHHMVLPVWSLDPLWVPFSSIHTRWSFAPEQVPLSRVYPTATVSRSFLGSASPWHADRNSAGGFLQSGSQQFGWGFGVHAYSELQFTLPRFAKSFRSRLGLDSLVGTGGCVRARIYVGSIQEKPLYESSFLIGSAKTVETGKIPLQALSNGQKHLVLQVDPAHHNRPRGADPLDIRDQLDWLDPLLELDKTKLLDEVRRHRAIQTFASPGWKIVFDPRTIYNWSSYFKKPDQSGKSQLFLTVQLKDQPLVLSREMTIGPDDQWLIVDVAVPSDKQRPPAISLSDGDQEIEPKKTPHTQSWQKRRAPLVFPLEKYRGKKVKLVLKQPIDGKALHWKSVKTSKQLPRAYHLARILKLAGQSNLQIPKILGSALHSRRMNDQEKIALVEIHRHGGIMNYWNPAVEELQPNDINNVLVGADWRGGDKTFMTFQKMPSLKSIFLIKEAGVSSGAVEKLLAVMPDLKVKHFVRFPSPQGEKCIFWLHNLTGKEVEIYWTDFEGNLALREKLDNRGHVKRHSSNVGARFEAHVDGKRISKFIVTPGRRWDIQPDK